MEVIYKPDLYFFPRFVFWGLKSAQLLYRGKILQVLFWTTTAF